MAHMVYYLVHYPLVFISSMSSIKMMNGSYDIDSFIEPTFSWLNEANHKNKPLKHQRKGDKRKSWTDRRSRYRALHELTSQYQTNFDDQLLHDTWGICTKYDELDLFTYGYYDEYYFEEPECYCGHLKNSHTSKFFEENRNKYYKIESRLERDINPMFF